MGCLGSLVSRSGLLASSEFFLYGLLFCAIRSSFLNDERSVPLGLFWQAVYSLEIGDNNGKHFHDAWFACIYILGLETALVPLLSLVADKVCKRLRVFEIDACLRSSFLSERTLAEIFQK